MSAVTYRAISRGQTPDGVWHDAGSMFTTDAPEGDWMQPLDDAGQPIAKEKRQPAPRPGSLDAIRKEISDKAKVIIADMQDDFDGRLKAESDRANAAEDELSKLKASATEKGLIDAEAAAMATQRAETAEKERDALQAEIAKLKATPAKK